MEKFINDKKVSVERVKLKIEEIKDIVHEGKSHGMQD